MSRHESLSIGELALGTQLADCFGLPYTTGDRWYVDDSGTDGYGVRGKSPDYPFATLDYAIGRCTASQGDQIILMPGHAETLTAQIAADVIGVTVIGLGHGDKRPTLTINFASSPGGLNATAADIKFVNVRIVAGATAVSAGTGASGVGTRLIRIAADNVSFVNCEISTAYRMFHMAAIISGDNIQFLNCTFLNACTLDDTTGAKAQTALLNHTGTNVLVKGCRFNDINGTLNVSKAEGWNACVEGGCLLGSITVEDCTFECRGIATRTRSAGASGYMATINCRAISPSSNTALGALYTPTYQFIIESYNCAAINVQNLLAAST